VNRNLKTLLFSIIGVAILAATILVLNLTQPDDDKTDPLITDAPAPILLTGNDEQNDEQSVRQLTAILIVNQQDDEGYTILVNQSQSEDEDEDEDQDITFTIPQLDERHDNVPYNQQSILFAVNDIARLTARDVVEIEESQELDLDKYGLENPQARITLMYDNDSTVVISVGDNAPTGSDIYVKIEGDDNIYTVAGHTVSAFFKDRFDWLIRQAFPEYDSNEAPEIHKVTITRSDLDQPIIITSIPTVSLEETRTFNSHKLISPFTVEVDNEKAMPTLFGIFALTAKEVAWVGLEELDYEFAGLNEPSCIVEVHAGETVYTLTIGSPQVNADGDTIAWFATSSEVEDILFLFDTQHLPWLRTAPENIISEMFLTPYIFSLERVEIVTSDITLIQSIKDDGSIDEFQSLYQFLMSAKGEDLFMDEGGDDLIVSITYVYSDEQFEPDVVEFFAADDRKSIIRINGQNMYKCRDLYTNRLLANIDAFMDGEEIIQSW
jgi:hypothetical protein